MRGAREERWAGSGLSGPMSVRQMFLAFVASRIPHPAPLTPGTRHLAPLVPFLLSLFALAFLLPASAQEPVYEGFPALIPYGGRIAVDGIQHDGAGYLKFSFVDAAGSTTYWSNDGTGASGSEPADAVATTFFDGRYSVVLGDTAVPNMTEIHPGLLPPTDLYLRVWFSFDNIDFEQLVPDTRVLPTVFALRAGFASRAAFADATGITFDSLPAGVIASSISPADSDLINAGFALIGELGDPPAWQVANSSGSFSARTFSGGAWSGSAALFWGGEIGVSTYSGIGKAYDPGGDAWSALSTFNAPDERAMHLTIWTGDRMVVWGGLNAGGYLDSGGIYNPSGDNWIATGTNQAPSGRSDHVSVWTGSEVVVWGGINSGGILGTGAALDISANTWTPTATAGAPAARYRHTAVWNGQHMIVWGGRGSNGLDRDDGARYDPAGDAWSPVSGTNAPAARSRHTAVWNGSKMLIWGGETNAVPLDSGAAYDPVADTWTPFSATGAPAARTGHSSLWTGSEMIVFGGTIAGQPAATGGRYDPAADQWQTLTTNGNPTPRSGHTAVWGGAKMFVFGGTGAGGARIGNLEFITPIEVQYLYRKL